MERTEIIKALECCTRGRDSNGDIPCLECPYNECNVVGGTSERQTSGTCQGWLMKDALALIKELTEEVKKLEQENDDLVSEKVIYIQDKVILKEENESLRDYCDNFLNITNDLVASERKVARKYAIMKMQNRLKAICWGEIISPSTIDRIANEILEE